MKNVIKLLQTEMAMPCTGLIMLFCLTALNMYESKHIDMSYKISAASKNMVYMTQDYGNGLIAQYLIPYDRIASYVPPAKVKYDPRLENHGIPPHIWFSSRIIYTTLSVLSLTVLIAFLVSLFFLMKRQEVPTPG